MKKTKILCTVGPASASPRILKKMYRAGMNGIRINTAFGSRDQHEEIIKTIRKVGDIAVLLDLKGPEIRIQVDEGIDIKPGASLEIRSGSPFEFSYNIYDQLSIGDRVLIDDGQISTRVTEKDASSVKLAVDRGGVIEDGKGVNIPRKQLIVPSLSERDLEALGLAREYAVEFIALSFVRSKEDLANLKSFTSNLDAGVIAKIENRQGVVNFEEIFHEADGVMVARGDLGVELAVEKVPMIQKHMIRRCNQEGKLAIAATEMLKSMTNNPTPTRAEVSDVANAVLDGSDVLMLSEETAIGKFPVEAVSMMTKVADEVEGSTRTNVREERFRTISNTVSRSIWQIAETMPLNKVVTLTKTGYTAKMITRFRLRQPILAVTGSKVVRNQLGLHYGVQPIHFDYEREKDRVLAVAKMLNSNGFLSVDENVLFTAGIRTSQPHTSNLIEIHTIRELLEFGKSQK